MLQSNAKLFSTSLSGKIITTFQKSVATHELFRTFYLLISHVYNNNLLKFIRIPMNDRPKLVEKLSEPCLFL